MIFIKTILVYGGSKWRNCVEIARDIARILHSKGVRDVKLYGTNAEVITNNVRVQVRNDSREKLLGRRYDVSFGYYDQDKLALIRCRDTTPHLAGGLIDYILKEEMSNENYGYDISKL